MVDSPGDGAHARVPGARGLLLLTLTGLAVRALFLLVEPPTSPVADERTWVNWAVDNLVTPKVRFSPLRTHMVFYPPAYPYFIAAAFELFASLQAVKWLQVVVSAALVPAVGRVGTRVFGARAGLAAAALTAFYPDLVWFSVHFWSETLFLTLLWWGLERLLAADATQNTRVAAGAGLLFGLAILTRETVLYFVPLVALWLLWCAPRARAPRRALAFLAVALGTVAPWTLRNWVVFDAFVPVSTAGGLNLFQGNARLTRAEVYALYEDVHGRIEQYRFARQAGIEAILARQPWWVFEKLRDEMPNFWEADSLALVHIKRGAYGPVSATAARAAAALVILPFLALLAAFVAGLATLTFDRRVLLLLGFLAYYNFIHVATHGFARYRMPIVPVLFVVAAAAWALRHERARVLPRKRMILAGAVALVFALSTAPSFARNYHHPAFGFASGHAPEPEPPQP